VGVRLTEPESSVFVTASGGLGAVFTGFEGQANPPWRAASGVRGGMLPYAHVDAGYWLAPRVALRADVITGFVLPQPVLSIAGHDVAVFGEPAVVFAASIVVRP
jgi:hypothetical protein